MNTAEYAVKRAFDYAVAGTGLIVLALPIAGVASLMAYVNRSDPFFTQERIGKNGRPFQIYKIRTLKDVFDDAGRALPDHQRSTAIGTFLRKTRIDELPQFVNVLKGEMSLIGPRPIQPFEEFASHPERQSVLPGLIGASQVRLGRRQSHLKLESDLDYISNQSLKNDLKILLEAPYQAAKRFRIRDFFSPAID